MQDVLSQSLKILKQMKIRKKRMTSLLLVLSLLVSLDVFWILRQPGLTLAGDADCGILEHTHEEQCGIQVNICGLSEEPHLHSENCYETVVAETYVETVLSCTITDESHEHTESCYTAEPVDAAWEQTLICGLSEEGHIHTEQCHVWELTCDLQEHVHSITCYSDENADTETFLDWQEMFAQYPYTNNLGQDLVGIAKTQVGYTESSLNFQISQDGIRRGYTRYGAWYGAPYSDWSAMFVSFCLHYAGADPEAAPGNSGAASMAERWNKLEKYAPAGEYIPVAGDLVFFTDNTVGIVAETMESSCYIIRGDMDRAVRSDILTLRDETIAGWGLTEKPVPQEEIPPETETPLPLPEQPADEVIPAVPAAPKEETIDLLDISNGPVFYLFAGEDAKPLMQRYSLRSPRTATELIPYLQSNGGNYFFTLLDFKNQELPKDADDNYIVTANTGYKLTLSFSSPNGFLPGTYQYQIPNGLMVDGGSGTFVLSDGTYVGDWEVTDTGLITLVFNEEINNRTDITLSATLGIHFPEQEDPIDFDGLIYVKVEPPPQQQSPTVLSKWGSPNNTAGKINWTVRIDGHADSQIPGNILTDQVALSDWSRPHSYTESDIAAGITFGVTDPNGGWHAWTVTADDPHLLWDESGWSYKIPQTVVCDYCGEIELGNDGWVYLINYTSTPTQLNTPGTFDYENKVTVDGQTAWGWSNFTQGEITAVIGKSGSFISDAGGGAFLWEVNATIPGRPEDQRAEYSWFIMDEMYLKDEAGNRIDNVNVQNEVHLSQVTATYNGGTIRVPRIQEATDADLFAWDDAWVNGTGSTRTINLLCRCQCTPETCRWGTCSDYWFERDDGTWATNGFCQCWTETQNVTFTFLYRTTDPSIVENYGTLGYHLNNQARLYYMPDGANSVQVSYNDAAVAVPNLFEKQLTHDFDGYTANYKITVNEAKLDLTNGTPLYIHDAMTTTLTYISGSMVITAEDANGNITTLKHNTDYTIAYDGTGNQTDSAGKPVHVLDIVILHPQPVMYTLDYDTTLIMPEQVTGSIKYSNSASITLWGESIKDSAVEKVYADINIAAKNYKVQMFKTCAKTNAPLAGATFGLYNEEGGLITQGVTDTKGELLFQTNVTNGIILREHIPYYMQELKAPTGYQLDNTEYWFCFCDKTTDSCEKCEAVLTNPNAVRIPFEQIGKVHATNQMLQFKLPDTGGPGIYPLMLASVMFIITPLVYGFIRRRKQERRGVR